MYDRRRAIAAAAQRARIEAGFAARRAAAASVDAVWQARIAGVCRLCRLGLLELDHGGEDAAAAMVALRRRGGGPPVWEPNERCGALAFARILRQPDFFLNFGHSTQDLWGGNDMMKAITRAASEPGSGLPQSLRQMTTVEGNSVLVATTYRDGRAINVDTGNDLAMVDPRAHPVLLRGPGHYNGVARDEFAKTRGVHMRVGAAGCDQVRLWLDGYGLYPVHSTGGGYCWYESMVWSLRALNEPVLVEALLLAAALGDEGGLGGGALF